MDLAEHLLRQMAFSHATFGPGRRMKGVIDHIRKELEEVEGSKHGSASEWVDVVILALDGLTRAMAYAPGSTERRDPATVAAAVCRVIVEKQSENEGRVWPDWRTADPGKAIEHVRE
jgi:hypothetical protein